MRLAGHLFCTRFIYMVSKTVITQIPTPIPMVLRAQHDITPEEMPDPSWPCQDLKRTNSRAMMLQQ